MVKIGKLLGDTEAFRNPSAKNWRSSPKLGCALIAVGKVGL